MRVRRMLWVFLALALVVSACGDDDATTTTTSATTTIADAGLTQKPGVLTVGSDVPYPPFEDFDAAGNVIGFDADLIEEIARRLGLTVEWIDTDFDTIFTQLATGRFDVVASATTITPERAQQVDFTDPYYNSQQAFTVNTNLTPGLVTTDALVAGDSVAVQTGTTGSDWATDNLAPRGIDVREFQVVGDMYNAAEAGQVKGVINDEPSAVDEVGNRDGLRIVQVIDTNEKYGFGVDPERSALLAAMNAAFADMLADGTYQTIYDTWFEAPAGSVLYDPRAEWPEALVFGFVPSRESETLQDNVDLLAQILSDALDIDVTGLVTPDYAALGLAMGTGSVQLGALPPRGYVDWSNVYPNIELFAQSERRGSLFYHTQYFTNDPSVCTGDPVEGAFTHAEDGSVIPAGPTETSARQVGWTAEGTREPGVDAGLRCPTPVGLEVVMGKTFAFVSEGSASGHLFPLGQLIAAGVVGGTYTPMFGGSHTGSVVAVYNGDADFGASFDDARTTALEAAGNDVGSKVIVFNISSPIPNDVIAVDANLPESLKDAIYQALADYIATEEGLALMAEIYDWTGLVRAGETTERAMDIIRQAIADLG